MTEQPDKVRKLLLCSGKIYYELMEERERQGAAVKDVTIVRVEQLAPFLWDKVAEQADTYKNATVVSESERVTMREIERARPAVSSTLYPPSTSLLT